VSTICPNNNKKKIKPYHSYLTLSYFIAGLDAILVVLLQCIHCVTVYFNNLHAYSHKAEIGSAQAYLKVQCNPVICRVVRKIHSPLTPIRVLSPTMQLIRIWCYLRNTEQFNILTLLLPHTCIPTYAHTCKTRKQPYDHLQLTHICTQLHHV